MTSGSVTADHAVSSRLRNSGGRRCTSAAAAAAWAKAPGTARSRARTKVSQKRSGRSSLASSVTHSRATGSRVPNHCATATVFPVAGPPVTSATRQSGWARTSARRGRAIARTGTAGHPNFESGTGSGPPPETTPARTPPIKCDPITPGSEVPGPEVPSGIWPGLRIRSFLPEPGARSAHPNRVRTTYDLRPPPCPSDPVLRCTIRSSRFPSSFEISRTYKPSRRGNSPEIDACATANPPLVDLHRQGCLQGH